MGFAADQINNGVRIAYYLFKALGPVINDGVCAEVAHGGNIVRRYGCDGLQARVTAQLNGMRSDIARCSVNDHRLTCFELGLVEQRLPCGDGNDRNGGGFNVG